MTNIKKIMLFLDEIKFKVHHVQWKRETQQNGSLADGRQLQQVFFLNKERFGSYKKKQSAYSF